MMDFYECEIDSLEEDCEMTPEQWQSLSAEEKLESLHNDSVNQSKKIGIIEENISKIWEAIERSDKKIEKILEKLEDHGKILESQGKLLEKLL